MRQREIARDQVREKDRKQIAGWFSDDKISKLKKIGVDVPELKKAAQLAFSLPSDSRNGNWFRKLLQLLDFQLDRPIPDHWHHVGKNHPLFNWCKDQRALLERDLGAERTDSDYRRARIAALHTARFPRESQTAIRLSRGRSALANMREDENVLTDTRPDQPETEEISAEVADSIQNEKISSTTVTEHDSPAANEEEDSKPGEQTGFSF